MKNRGISTLFDAFEILKKKYHNMQLILAGPRDVSIPHREGIHDLGVLPLEKVPKLLNTLDVGVICNQNNSFGKYCFPQKAREMMACDIPIVAAKVGSMVDLFKNNAEWLFPPNNPKELASVIEKRLKERLTNYGEIPDWSHIGGILEGILMEVTKA